MAAKKKTVKKNTKKNMKKNTNTKTQQPQHNKVAVYMISLSVITLFLGIFMYIGNQSSGVINTFIKFVFCGVLGYAGYLIPVVLAGLTIYLGKTHDIKRFWIKFTLCFLALTNIAALIGLNRGEDVLSSFLTGAYNYIGGGFLGAVFAEGARFLIQTVASYVLYIITLILLISFIIHVPLFRKFAVWLRDTSVKLKNSFAENRAERAEIRAAEEEEERTAAAAAQEHKNEALEAANSFAGETSSVPKSKPEEKKQPVQKDEAPAEKEDFSDGIEEVFGGLEEEPLTESGKKKKEKASEKEQAADKEPPEKAEPITEKEKKKYSKELEKAMDTPPVHYIFPPANLLDTPTPGSADRREELRKTAEKLIKILEDFGVKAKLLQVTQGPTVTRYEVQPETGIKLAKIVSLSEDLALNLAVSNVLVAAVPGKAAVGIEIPNKKISSVSLREMITSDEFTHAKSKLTVALGKDIGGNVIVGDISKWPHMLIAGETGSGKSVCINTMITSILYKASPEDVKMIMVDPKVVELGSYNGIPHLLIPVVTDPKKAAGALNWAVVEMMRRYELFKESGVKKLENYNKLMENTGGEKIPQLVIIIDELADLMMAAAKEVEGYICRLAQLARAAGMHLVIATQRPSVDVITGLIKANIPSRIAFAVSSQIDSRTILDHGGAEKLLGMGDMLYFPTGARSATRVQGAYVSDEEIEKILGYIKSTTGETHYSEDLAEEIENCASGENGVTPDIENDGDALLPDAVRLAAELGKISTSMIQRRLGVGYSRAGRIIDQMEARGIITGANGSKPRDVLISTADLDAEDYGDEDEESENEEENEGEETEDEI